MGARVEPLDDGGIRVSLAPSEHALLRSLPEQLRPVLEGAQDLAGAAKRLYPAAYDDAELEAEYRALTNDDLVAERVGALETFAETLDGGQQRLRSWSTVLTTEQAGAWLSAINDARLVLAAVVGITDEREWERGPRRGEPASVALYYLGWLQELLIEGLWAVEPGS